MALPCLSIACTTEILFDDIFVNGEVDASLDSGGGGGDDDDGDDSDDTDIDIDCEVFDPEHCAYDGEIEIVASRVSCNSPDTVLYEIETDGLMTGARFFQEETGNAGPHWADNHTLSVNVQNDYGQGSTAERLLFDAVDVVVWEQDVSTVFPCGTHITLPGVMTFAVAAEDLDGNIADCVVYGDDPQGMIDRAYDRVNEPEFDLSQCRITSFP